MNLPIDARATSRRGLLLIVLTAVLWGTVGTAVQLIYGLAETNPLSIGFFRLLFSVPVLLAACWHTLGRRMFRITPRDLGHMLLMGAFMAFYQVCYFASIARVGVAIAVLVTLCTAPVMVALLSALLLRERLTGAIVLALACALAGTVLLIWVGPETGGARRDTLAGVLLALGSAFGYTMLTLCSRTLSGRYHPLQPISIGFAAGALLLLPFALATGFVISYPSGVWAVSHGHTQHHRYRGQYRHTDRAADIDGAGMATVRRAARPAGGVRRGAAARRNRAAVSRRVAPHAGGGS